MTAIPAAVAGVPERVLCVPPAADGSIAAVTLAAAFLTGVEEVYRVGGAQAIAAMAYGTESIARGRRHRRARATRTSTRRSGSSPVRAGSGSTVRRDRRSSS